MLLEEGWGYSTGVGVCSTHNHRAGDSHPCGVGRPEDSLRVEPTSNHRREAAREPERAGQRHFHRRLGVGQEASPAHAGVQTRTCGLRCAGPGPLAQDAYCTRLGLYWPGAAGVDRERTSFARTALSRERLGADPSGLREKYVLEGNRSSRCGSADPCAVGTVARRPAVPAYLVGVRPRVR